MTRGRRIAWGALILMGVLALLLAVGILWLRSALPRTEGEIALSGIRADVEIWRDARGVPHVFAADEHDLYFAQGFLHAQDRLWQMDLVRRVAQGRLAEALGAGLVESDRFLRTLGLWRAAGDQEAAMAPVTRAPLEAYAAGINAFLETRTGALPPEFLALGIEPEPWTVRHSLAVEKVMAWDLALYGGAAEAARSLRTLGPDTVAALLIGYPEWGTTILEGPVPPEIPETAAILLDALSATRASNAWVIGGAHTRSGRPILANDMHLALRQPSLWYLAAHHAGDLDVAGMTLPGVPYVIAGHNRAVAWGFTNASLDDVDFFAIRVDSTDATVYLTAGGPQRFRVAAETIRVKGADPVPLNVRLTRFGPVLSLTDDARDLVALRWAAHDPSRSHEAFPAFAKAASVDDVLAAVQLFDNPHQNVVFADTAGRIGYAMGGRIPMRGEGRLPPTLPVPSWTGEWDWTGYLPFSEHPVVLDPPQGYIVTANNRQAAGERAERISSDWEMPFRAQRIRAMIRAGGPFDADAVHRMQLDVHDALAERYVGHAVAAARAAGRADAAALLAAWDLAAVPDSPGAALFYVWFERVRAGIRRDLYGGDDGWLPRDAVNAALDGGALPWAAEAGVDRLRTITEVAALEADSIAAGRSWGELHRAEAEHALSVSAPLERLLGLNVGPAPAPGSPTTVNVAHHGGARFPVTVTAAASQRHVVDLGNIDGAGGFILPGGQSGLPFSRHYADQWDAWLHGGLWPLPLDPQHAVAGGVRRLVLRAELQQ